MLILGRHREREKMHLNHVQSSNYTIKCLFYYLYYAEPPVCDLRLPCLVSPERDDLVDTDDCTETTEVVSAMVLSVTNPPPSPSVWTVIFD